MNPEPDHAELLQQLMDNIDDNIFFKDRDSRFIMINRANAGFFGLKDPREAVGKDDFDYFDRDHAEKMREEELRIMETGVPVVGEQQLGGGDQYVGWGSVTKIPLRDCQGRIVGTMGIGRDISELKQKEKELEQTNDTLREVNEQVAEDLRMAAELQQTFMPREYPVFPSSGGGALLGFHHCYMPHSDLGGDFCSVYRLNEVTAGLLICDVMGHGVRAALVTGIIRAFAEELVRFCDGPAAFMTAMNQRLAPVLQSGEDGLFATAAFLTVNAETGELTCALAGHCPPLLVGPGRAEPLALARADTGPALAITKNHRYATASFRMQPGEAVLLYTDGIIEARNAAQEEFGQEGLLRVARRRCDGFSLEELVVRITRAVKDHVGAEPPADDICMLGAALA